VFGERLKLARKRAGLSLRALSAGIGSRVSAQAIGKYERGEMMPGSDALDLLAKVLDVSPQYLMSDQVVELSDMEFRKRTGTSARDRAAVEVAALLVRLNRYGIIGDQTLAYAFQTFAKGWRAEEPEPIEAVELRGQLEKPRRFQRLCYRALAERYITPGKAMELLKQPLDHIEQAMRGPEVADAHAGR